MAFPVLPFISVIVRYLTKYLAFLVPFAAWFSKTWAFILNKLLIGYFGSRIWVTITLLSFALLLVGSVAQIFSTIGSSISSLVLEALPPLPEEGVNFLLNFITVDWIFECVGFFFGAFVTYVTAIKSLWVFKQTLRIFNVVSKAVK